MTTETQASAHNVLEDPLSRSTRSAKRLMLVLSCISFLIVLTGVRPDEVSVFGLKFPGLNLSVLNYSLLTLLVVSIVSFFVYGLSDFFRFWHRLDVYNRSRAHEIDRAISTDPNSDEEQKRRFWEKEFEEITGYKYFEIPHGPTKALTNARVFIDFLLPMAFGVLSLVLFISLQILG